MRRNIFSIKVVSLLFVLGGLIIVGIITKKSFGNVFYDMKTSPHVLVGTMPEGVSTIITENLENDLNYSNFILKVKILSGPIVCNYAYGYNVEVTKIFKGDSITIGDVFFLTKGSWATFLDTGVTYEDDYQYINLGFTNFLKEKSEYLVFIENKLNTIDGSAVYCLYDYVITPAFCYEEGNSRPHPSVVKDGKFVPYCDVADDEFICESQQSLGDMLRLKKSVIDRYH